MATELWIRIQTGFADGKPDAKYIEFTFKKVDGSNVLSQKIVKLPFDKLEKSPMNNSPVFMIQCRTAATPEELQTLIEDLKGLE